jgi:hypothetical protein
MPMRRTGWLPTIRSLPPLSFLLAAIVFGATGCNRGPPIAEVSGKVSFEGQPVTEGVINFASESGFGIQSQLGADGRYRLHSHHGKGIPLGTYKVSISPPPFDPVPADLSQPPPRQPEYPNIPQRYRSFQTSGLVAEVVAEDNVFDFEMTP